MSFRAPQRFLGTRRRIGGGVLARWAFALVCVSPTFSQRGVCAAKAGDKTIQEMVDDKASFSFEVYEQEYAHLYTSLMNDPAQREAVLKRVDGNPLKTMLANLGEQMGFVKAFNQAKDIYERFVGEDPKVTEGKCMNVPTMEELKQLKQRYPEVDNQTQAKEFMESFMKTTERFRPSHALMHTKFELLSGLQKSMSENSLFKGLFSFTDKLSKGWNTAVDYMKTTRDVYCGAKLAGDVMSVASRGSPGLMIAKNILSVV